MSAVVQNARRLPISLNWFGVAPFLIFAVLFLILPTLHIVVGAFRTPEGSLTLVNLQGLAAPNIVNATWISMKLSLLTALLGCVIGLLLAIATTRGGLPSGLRDATLTFAGVAWLPVYRWLSRSLRPSAGSDF